jgi:hypothetical protein
MTTASSNTLDQSYDNKALRTNRTRALRRKILKSIVPCAVVLGCASFGLQYLAKLPRERFARDFSFTERAWLGLTTSVRGAWLSLHTAPEVGKDSPLPRAELYLRGKRLDALTDHLPESGRKAQKAKIRMNGEEFDVTARLRGDSMNHWAYPQKSWRVSLKGNDFYEGMKELNLNVPRSDSQIANWLGYEMAKRAGMPLVPTATNMQFRLNRKFDGVRLLLEQPNEDFIAARGLPQGKIYVGDISTEQIYGAKERPRLYTEADPWEVRTSLGDTSKREMSEMLRIVREVHDPYAFLKQINEVLDLKAMAQYIALLDLVGSVHIDETHNGKFYFNPTTGKLVPIVWDTVAYFWGDRHELDQASSNLFRVLLANPGFRDMKDQELWRMVSGELGKDKLNKIIDNEIASLAPDTEAFALKLRANDKGVKHLSNEDWFAGVEATKAAVAGRDLRVRQWLGRSDTRFSLVPRAVSDTSKTNQYELTLSVAGPAGIELTAMNLVTKPTATARPAANSSFTIERRGVSDMMEVTRGLEQAAKEGFGATEIAYSGTKSTRVVLNDRLLSKRRFVDRKVPEVVPSLYVYTITVPDGLELAKVDFFARNAITKRAVKVKLDAAIAAPVEHKKNSLWWSPSTFLPKVNQVLEGQVAVDSDIVVTKGSTLNIKPGTTLLMQPGVSLFINGGQIIAEGTKAKPIVIKGSGDTAASAWGVIGLKGAKGSFKHVQVFGGSNDIETLTVYPAALSFYGSKVVFEDGVVEGGSISADGSELALSRITYTNTLNDLVKSVRSKVVSDAVSAKPAPVQLSLVMSGENSVASPSAVFTYEMTDYSLGKGEAQKLVEGVGANLSKSCLAGSLALKTLSLCGVVQVSKEEKLTVDEGFAYEVYFDSEAAFGLRSKTSLSARYVFESKDSFENHLKKPLWAKAWPIGFSYQSQFGWEQEEGSSTSAASYVEVSDKFGAAALPEKALPAYAPWAEEEFLRYLPSGRWRGTEIAAAKVFADRVRMFAGPELAGVDSLEISPKLVEVVREFRIQLTGAAPAGIKAEAGAIKIQRVKLYDAPTFLHFVSEKKLGEKIDEPKEVQDLAILEVAVAPELLSAVEAEISKANAAANSGRVKELKAYRRSIMQDLETLAKEVKNYLASQQIEVRGVKEGRFGFLSRLRS